MEIDKLNSAGAYGMSAGIIIRMMWILFCDPHARLQLLFSGFTYSSAGGQIRADV